MKCEVCGNDANGVCPRCYRFVCGECIDPTTLECIDCSSTKRIIEDDLLRYVDSMERKLSFMESKLLDCFSCPLYKDSLLGCVRRVKELESVAKLEAFERLAEKLPDIKERAQKLAVNYLVRLKMGTGVSRNNSKK
ncbi:MAG: hypothetical protein ABWW66_07445 [Archaeoglobaceae archaeon]